MFFIHFLTRPSPRFLRDPPPICATQLDGIHDSRRVSFRASRRRRLRVGLGKSARSRGAWSGPARLPSLRPAGGSSLAAQVGLGTVSFPSFSHSCLSVSDPITDEIGARSGVLFRRLPELRWPPREASGGLAGQSGGSVTLMLTTPPPLLRPGLAWLGFTSRPDRALGLSVWPEEIPIPELSGEKESSSGRGRRRRRGTAG